MSIVRSFAAAAALTSVLVSGASAATILTSDHSLQEAYGYSFSSSQWEAVGFYTGASGSYDIDSVTMRLAGLTPGQVSTAIYSSGKKIRYGGWNIDTGYQYITYDAPSVCVGSESVQAVGDKGDYTFQFTDVTLLADTLYWVVFKGLGSDTFKYFEHQYRGPSWNSSFTSDTGASLYGFEKSPCSQWGCPTQIIGSDWDFHSGLNIISINGSLNEVPEPGSLALAGLGVAGLLIARKRRGQRRRLFTIG